jgi:hypothetical protein
MAVEPILGLYAEILLTAITNEMPLPLILFQNYCFSRTESQECFAGGSIATGRISLGRPVE